MEINPTHPIVIDLNRRIREGENSEDLEISLKVLFDGYETSASDDHGIDEIAIGIHVHDDVEKRA